jgi:dynein heavy chain
MAAACDKYKYDKDQPMNVVLTQELEKFCRLRGCVAQTLFTLSKAVKGLVAMTEDWEVAALSLLDAKVPMNWRQVTFESTKPLEGWYDDLLKRIKFFTTWVERGTPAAFWFSAFFFPQGSSYHHTCALVKVPWL